MNMISIREVNGDHPRPESPSEWDDWGPKAPELKDMVMRRWLIELTDESGGSTAVGDLSAHAVWYGPTPASKAMNIGISIVEDYRRQGIGTTAQRLLAELLHAEGVVRVEASTDIRNIGEQRALERAGFELEGTLRQAQRRADGQHDLQSWSHVLG